MRNGLPGAVAGSGCQLSARSTRSRPPNRRASSRASRAESQ